MRRNNMAAFKNWLDDIVDDIGRYKERFSKKDSKKYKLDFLLRIAKRVDSFYAVCGECQLFQGEITKIVKDLDGSVQSSEYAHKSYDNTIKRVVGHLKKKHKLVTQGTYMGIGTTISMAIGTVFGLALGNIGTGIAVGTGLGTGIGSALEAKAKKDGKTI